MSLPGPDLIPGLPAWVEIALAVLLAPFAVGTFVVLTTRFACVLSNRRVAVDERWTSAFARERYPLLLRWGGLASECFWQSAGWYLHAARIVGFFPRRLPKPGAGRVVLLLPGFIENGAFLLPLAWRLRGRGYQPVVTDMPSTVRSIEKNAEHLGRRVQEALEASGERRVALVGHSMGGLICRLYAKRTPDAPVAVIATIGSPHHGTRLSPKVPCTATREMTPGSALLEELNAPGNVPVPVHSTIALQDNIVSPPWSAFIGEGEDVVLERPVGHVAPLFLRTVARRIADWLDAADWSVDASEE